MNEIITKKNEFYIFVYSSFESRKPDHTFIATTKREVVGLMKTVMDNFQVSHIDIMSKRDFYKLDQDQTSLT